MLDLLKRCVVPAVASILLVTALIVGSIWLSLFAIALLVLSAYDWFQRDYVLTRNFPVAGHFRWLFLQLRPYLRAYIVEDDLSGTPYSFEAKQLIRSRARDESDTQPFGTERDTDRADYHWLAHSMAPHPSPDESPRVLIGNEQTNQPFSASLLNISAMSFGSLSAAAIEALNIGAKLGNFYHDTGEGGLSKYHLKHGGDLVWELGSGYFGARTAKGRFDADSFRDKAASPAVKMIELKLSQGAKPGHGGLLPAKKVTSEIAEVRQVPEKQDCISPRTHSEFSNPIELLEFIARLRDLSGSKPVGIKLCIGQTYEVFALMKAILLTQIYPDYIVVDGGEGGTGAAPQEFSDWIGMPLQDGLIVMRNALVGAGLKGKIRLAASGKVYSGIGVLKNLAIGADWCNAGRAFMMSVGCVQAQRCHLGTCPTGVATQDQWRQRGLIPDIQGERAARFHAKTIHSLVELTAAAGFAHPQDLMPKHFLFRTACQQAKPLDQIHQFLAPNELLETGSSNPYASIWQQASAEKFAL